MSGQTLKEAFDGDRTIIRYLLGESSPQEQTEIEERYFSEPNFLERVVAVEDDLIDAYLHHELTENERERFENYFLVSPDRRERVEIAEALLTRLTEARVSGPAPAVETTLRSSSARMPRGHSGALPKRPFFGWLSPERLELRFAFAALLMVAVVGGLWLFVQNQRLQTQLEQARAEKTQLQQQEQQLQQQLRAREAENTRLAQAQKLERTEGETSNQKPAESTPRSAIASFILMPGLTRDVVETNKLVIPSGAQFVRLQLSIDSRNEYKNYDASLQRVGAGDIWHRNLREHQPSTGNVPHVVKLPARLFTAGEYLLTLRGASATGQVDVIGDYSFTVVRERK